MIASAALRRAIAAARALGACSVLATGGVAALAAGCSSTPEPRSADAASERVATTAPTSGPAAEATGDARATDDPPPTPAVAGTTFRGRASYYANKFAGRRTASGERYDPRAMTCAHRTLPFGTVLDVENESGVTVRVRVNDRGPFHAGRALDLSKAAATRLGLLRAGVDDVTARIVSVPPPKAKKTKKTKK